MSSNESREDTQTQADEPEHREADCSEAALAELMDECEEQFHQLQMLHGEIILAEPDSSESPQAVNRLTTIAAELKQWQAMQPRLLLRNSEVLLVTGKEELQTINAQLEMVLSYSQAKRDKLKETLKSEQRWLEEKGEVLSRATELVASLHLQNQQLSEESVLQETKKKIQKMKGYQDRLMEALGDVLEQHFPLPQHDTNVQRKKKNTPQQLNENLISLHEILELLMNKSIETPHDPYLLIDETFWPPYTEMLLRYGIALRHPEDCYKIRLEHY